MKKFNSIICGILSIAFALTIIPLFSGCDGGDEYKKFASNYDTFVKNNSDIFDSNGEISISYGSALDSVINKNSPTLDDKLAKFPRLTCDANSDQGVYEPVLKASLLYVNCYIHKMDNVKVSSKDARKISDKFEDFQTKVNEFKLQLSYLEDHSDSLNSNSQTENNNLETVLDSMYNLIIAANDFNYTFMEFYESATAPKKGETKRGTIEKFYLRNLAHTCNVYIKLYLPIIHTSKPAIDNSKELYTGYDFCRFVNKMLVDYLDSRSKIQTFDKKSGELTGNDKQAYNYYLYVTEYERLYQKSCRCMIMMSEEWLEAMKEAIIEKYDNTKKASSESVCTVGFVADCNADCVIMQNMLKEFANQI